MFPCCVFPWLLGPPAYLTSMMLRTCLPGSLLIAWYYKLWILFSNCLSVLPLIIISEFPSSPLIFPIVALSAPWVLVCQCETWQNFWNYLGWFKIFLMLIVISPLCFVWTLVAVFLRAVCYSFALYNLLYAVARVIHVWSEFFYLSISL